MKQSENYDGGKSHHSGRSLVDFSRCNLFPGRFQRFISLCCSCCWRALSGSCSKFMASVSLLDMSVGQSKFPFAIIAKLVSTDFRMALPGSQNWPNDRAKVVVI